VGVKHLSETFTDSEHEELSQVKGDRSWREAILEEFGVDKEGTV
jgi:hypothetical protein